MSENFNDKDYAEYFAALQKNLEKGNTVNQMHTDCNDKKSSSYTPRRKIIIWRAVLAVILMFAAVSVFFAVVSGGTDTKDKPIKQTEKTENTVSDVEKKQEDVKNIFADFGDYTKEISSDIDSGNIIVVDCQSNKVVAARNAQSKCYPASTTKIMTILTAVDYITDYNDTFTFSYEVTDSFYLAGATMAGFSDGEAVNMTDMLYGTILPSGADASAGLAIKLAGSEEKFVALMNKKAQELGLKGTHFTNCTGLFDENHYTTPEDMSVILQAAMENELCKKILSTYQYTTAATPQHPEGIPLTSTLFSYMYGTEPEGSDILGGKTGFVNESGYCIATFGVSDGGREYVCITFNGLSLWPTVYDQIDLYSEFVK